MIAVTADVTSGEEPLTVTFHVTTDSGQAETVDFQPEGTISEGQYNVDPDDGVVISHTYEIIGSYEARFQSLTAPENFVAVPIEVLEQGGPIDDPGPEIPSGDLGVYIRFSKTEDHGGGQTSTMYLEFQLPEVNGVDIDDVALALIPLFEDADYVFEHVRVTIAQTSVHDPRNP